MRSRGSAPGVLSSMMVILAAGASLCAEEPVGKTGPPRFRAVPSAESGVHNLFRVGDRVYSGSGPESLDDFRFLASLGIKTVVSVDGAVPDVDTARELGIRYFHLPLKYAEPTPGDVRRLASVLERVTGPVYVHCHHGKHRGPAATAILCRQAGILSQDEASAFLAAAGTGKQYRGLWKCVGEFSPMTFTDDLPELPEQVPPQGLQLAMVRIDELFQALKQGQGSTDPEVRAAEIRAHGISLEEEFRESARLGTDDAEMRKLLVESASLVEKLRRAENQEQAGEALKSLERRCTECHTNFRQ